MWVLENQGLKEVKSIQTGRDYNQRIPEDISGGAERSSDLQRCITGKSAQVLWQEGRRGKRDNKRQ
jgi:hypothetical protein